MLRLLNKLFDGKREEFNRGLPINELLSDRWERADKLNFGDGTNIYDSSIVLGDVKVGNNCWIGPFTILDGSGEILIIGDNCDISAGVQIYTHDTVDKTVLEKEIKKGKVVIGNNCYIGPNVVISKGVTIGNYVVIGANSFVNKDIVSNSKAFGTPATIKEKRINEE